ncbi:hypothetical protein D3C71_1741990 [compost metagenome]
MMILNSDLPNSTRPWMPKIRLSPAIGETRLSFGWMRSRTGTGRFWKMEAPTPKTMSRTKAGTTRAVDFQIRWVISATTSVAFSSRQASGCSKISLSASVRVATPSVRKKTKKM